MTALRPGTPFCDPPFMLGDPDMPSRPRPPAAQLPGPRRFDDGLWSRARYSFDGAGREMACVTHADGHSIAWLALDPSHSFLIAPDGSVLRTPEAYAEARDYAEYWGAP